MSPTQNSKLETRNSKLETPNSVLFRPVLRRLLVPRLARQYGLRDLDHRDGTVLARALEDAIRLLLRGAGAAHQNPLGALDGLPVLQRLARAFGILARRGELAGARGREAERRIQNAWRGRLRQEGDRRRRRDLTLGE